MVVSTLNLSYDNSTSLKNRRPFGILTMVERTLRFENENYVGLRKTYRRELIFQQNRPIETIPFQSFIKNLPHVSYTYFDLSS